MFLERVIFLFLLISFRMGRRVGVLEYNPREERCILKIVYIYLLILKVLLLLIHRKNIYIYIYIYIARDMIFIYWLILGALIS